MNYAIVLAAGVGQRMRNGGMPKQFLKLMGKPIVIYTLERFEGCEDIDSVIIACHGSYIEHMQHLVDMYQMNKVSKIIVGGNDRQSSLIHGLETITDMGGNAEDIVVIHDGVRPLVHTATICENIRLARQFGAVATVCPVTESVVITNSDQAYMDNFKKRSDTYTMTSPQSFQLGKIIEAYKEIEGVADEEKPLLDAAMVYAQVGGEVHLVKEQGKNIKITTPEDFYFLKAILELEEHKYIFGL